MTFKDLPPAKDPKGGSASSSFSLGASTSGEDMSKNTPIIPAADDSNASSNVWRTLALVLMAMMGTGVVSYFTIGFDNVKHSEVNAILDRSPYNLDKQRINDHLESLEKRDNELRGMIQELRTEWKANDESILRELRETERQSYQRYYPNDNSHSKGPP